MLVVEKFCPQTQTRKTINMIKRTWVFKDFRYTFKVKSTRSIHLEVAYDASIKKNGRCEVSALFRGLIFSQPSATCYPPPADPDNSLSMTPKWEFLNLFNMFYHNFKLIKLGFFIFFWLYPFIQNYVFERFLCVNKFLIISFRLYRMCAEERFLQNAQMCIIKILHKDF